jgi:hypothetical protein
MPQVSTVDQARIMGETCPRPRVRAQACDLPEGRGPLTLRVNGGPTVRLAGENASDTAARTRR